MVIGNDYAVKIRAWTFFGCGVRDGDGCETVSGWRQ